MNAENGLSVGFVGLGSMGGALVERLLAGGHAVTGWNRTKEKAAGLIDRGMRWSDTPGELAADVDVVFSMVTDGAAVQEVATGPEGIAAGLKAGSVYADMSTIGPDTSRAVAERIAQTGASMLDAPVSGSVATLQAGQLAIMVGGPEESFKRIKPVLLSMGPKVTHIGGNGQALQVKVAINLALVVQVIGFCEGVALAERGGVPRETAVEAMLKSVVSSPVLNYRGPFILEGNMPESAWADVDLQQKDLLLAIELGRKLGVPLPAAAVCNELLNAARGLGIGHHDFVVVYEVYRRLSGMDA